nr:hypothetical protein [Pedobacter sp. ASV2]
MNGSATNYSGTGKLPLALFGEVKYSTVEASASVTHGNNKFASHISASGKILTVEAEQAIGIFTGEGNREGIFFGAKLGAAVAKAEVRSGITIFGIKISF